VSRAELLASLSLAVDLGLGQPMEHVLRQTVIGMRLAERAGMDESTREAVYYVSLIAGRVHGGLRRTGPPVRR